MIGALCLGISNGYDMLMGAHVERAVAMQLRPMQAEFNGSASAAQHTAQPGAGLMRSNSSQDSGTTSSTPSSSSDSGSAGVRTLGLARKSSQQVLEQRWRSRASRRQRSRSYDVRFHPDVDQLLVDQRQLNYTCYEPTAGLSSPVVTIITIINLQSKHHLNFIHNHRLAYAVKHGYRQVTARQQLQQQQQRQQNIHAVQLHMA